MREMINGLLTLSRAVSHEVSREQVDTASLVADLKTMIEEGQDRKVVIEIGELPTLCGDRALLNQLFQNPRLIHKNLEANSIQLNGYNYDLHLDHRA